MMRDPRIDILFPMNIIDPMHMITLSSGMCVLRDPTVYVFDLKGRRFSSKKYRSKDKLPSKWLKWSLSL